MTDVEDYDPALDPNSVPLLGEKETPIRHRVKAHERTLPPGPRSPEDPDALRLFDPPPLDPPRPRTIPVRPHVRRNPRPRSKETAMDPIHSATVQPIAHLGESRADLARLHDPQTSHDAAESLTTISRSQAWVLERFRRQERMEGPTGARGYIDHDLQRMAETYQVRLTSQRIRTARHDLFKAGLLRKTGAKKTTPYGRRAEVYALTEAGRRVTFTPYEDSRTDGR